MPNRTLKRPEPRAGAVRGSAPKGQAHAKTKFVFVVDAWKVMS